MPPIQLERLVIRPPLNPSRDPIDRCADSSGPVTPSPGLGYRNIHTSHIEHADQLSVLLRNTYQLRLMPTPYFVKYTSGAVTVSRPSNRVNCIDDGDPGW